MKGERIEVIENIGPNNLRDYLKGRLTKTSQVDIAVAFATKAGVDEVLPYLRRVASKGRVRIIVGLYQQVTEPEALRSLLRAQKQTEGRLVVHLSKESKFHTKLYLLKKSSGATVITGSSNLTKEGLTSGGELNVVLSLQNGSPALHRIEGVFENEWENTSVPLYLPQVEEYARSRPKNLHKNYQIKLPLQAILKAKPIHKKAPEIIKTDKKYWRDYLLGYTTEETNLILSQATDWDERGYVTYTPGKHSYNKGDRLLLFNIRDSWLSVVEIKALTEISTPDGRYFVAYKPIKNIPQKRLTENLWQRLKSAGFIQKKADAYVRRRLSQERWNELLAFLKAR